jgi:arginine utilization protein RocB
MTNELTLEENKAEGFDDLSLSAKDWVTKVMQELDARQMSFEERAMAEMQLMKEAQLAYYYEEMAEERAKAEQKMTAREIAEQKTARIKQEIARIKQTTARITQEIAKIKQESERNGHKLLIKSFLKINYSKEQVAELQNWSINYVEDLVKEINQEEK